MKVRDHDEDFTTGSSLTKYILFKLGMHKGSLPPMKPKFRNLVISISHLIVEHLYKIFYLQLGYQKNLTARYKSF